MVVYKRLVALLLCWRVLTDRRELRRELRDRGVVRREPGRELGGLRLDLARREDERDRRRRRREEEEGGAHLLLCFGW